MVRRRALRTRALHPYALLYIYRISQTTTVATVTPGYIGLGADLELQTPPIP